MTGFAVASVSSMDLRNTALIKETVQVSNVEAISTKRGHLCVLYLLESTSKPAGLTLDRAHDSKENGNHAGIQREYLLAICYCINSNDVRCFRPPERYDPRAIEYRA